MIRDGLLLTLAVVAGLAGLSSGVVGLRILVHEFHQAWWGRSLIAYELRVPRTATVKDVARWTGTLRSVLRARRWWSLLPRRPIGVETIATSHGITHVLILPRRLHAAVLATLSAALPGARLHEAPHYLSGKRRPRFQVATEARMTGTTELLALDRAEETSRHVVAAMQPLLPGECVWAQWLVTAARPPRWITKPDVDPALTRISAQLVRGKGSGEFVAEGASAPPGDGGVG